MNSVVFISHSTSDKDIAAILRDFLISIGINNDLIFCSSLPSNGVNEKIPDEVKENLNNSKVNIALLSNNYYGSAYCLNEAGIIWFQDKPAILIGLPEIKHKDMQGFLDSNYILRRINNNNDLSYICDIVHSALDISTPRLATISEAIEKTVRRYNEVVSKRETENAQNPVTLDPDVFFSSITTDDEKVVLYYILSNKIRKVTKQNVKEWLQEKEIYGIKIENAFDLLSSVAEGKTENDTLELDIDFFRKLISQDQPDSLLSIIEKHKILSSDTFKNLYLSGDMEDIYILFAAYIVDEKEEKFGYRWKDQEQIEKIKKWEEKYSLLDSLSENYLQCIYFFIANKLVYESDWTSYGNAREYTLCRSLKEYLFYNCDELYDDILRVKKAVYYEPPF